MALKAICKLRAPSVAAKYHQLKQLMVMQRQQQQRPQKIERIGGFLSIFCYPKAGRYSPGPYLPALSGERQSLNHNSSSCQGKWRMSSLVVVRCRWQCNNFYIGTTMSPWCLANEYQKNPYIAMNHIPAKYLEQIWLWHQWNISIYTKSVAGGIIEERYTYLKYWFLCET